MAENRASQPDPATLRVPLSRRTAALFFRMLANFGASEVGLKAKLGFATLLGLLLAINALNVVNSYVGRDFMTAIEQRSMDRFSVQALRYVGVFGLSTGVAVIYRFTEERLGLLWRDWLTRRLVNVYMGDGIYYRLSQSATIANPDQRIADDVRALTGTSLSFLLMVANATMTIVAFSGVLWSISPLLFGVAVGYAAVGSLFTVLLGRRLVPLGYAQSDREADLRAGLVHVRENAESIFLGQREGRLRARSLRQIDELVANARRIIAVNRNLGFFTTGYSYLIQIIPAVIIAPHFIRGECEFGVIPQSAMAFSHLLGAFSLIVNQFQQISSYTVVLARLGALGEEAGALLTAQPSRIALVTGGHDEIVYENLTLDADDGTTLVRDLAVTIPHGLRVLVTGANAAAKSALLHASAGAWEHGSGTIVRPPDREVLFLAERPYVPPATLREVLVRTGEEGAVPDPGLVEALASLGLESVPDRAGGLDTEHDWDDLLSLRELQLLVVARVLLTRPRFVFLERIDNTLDARDVERALSALASAGITAIVLGDGESGRLDLHGAVLDLGMDGRWSWKGSTPTTGNDSSRCGG